MSRFGMTGKIVARADRDQDPYAHIDRIRQEVYDLGEQAEAQEKRIIALEAAWRERLTEARVQEILRNASGASAIDWGKWAVRAVLGAMIIAIFGGVGRLFWGLAGMAFEGAHR